MSTNRWRYGLRIRRPARAMPYAQDRHLVADNFVADDVGVNRG